ncbi:MAG: pirin family protein [Fibrobacterota bacterium]
MQVLHATPVVEGAGVRLNRVFGFHDTRLTDPFLLFDHFGSDNPDDYLAGFPWHPHRGIETVTYIIEGAVEHGDSMGNKGTIRSGDVQWMTAGSGIIHQEMPQEYEGTLQGFQLWVNLPSRLKMSKPRYRSILASEIPEVQVRGARVKVICGELDGVRGPALEIAVAPSYFDLFVPAKKNWFLPLRKADNSFAYVYEGQARFNNTPLKAGGCVFISDSDALAVETEGRSVQFVFASGRPLREPVAWKGPIVMNTDEELETAFREYQAGTFVR